MLSLRTTSNNLGGGKPLPTISRIMIEEYINYLVSIKGYSKNTAESYRKDLTFFVNWAKWNVTTPRWSMIKRDDIDRYITSLTSYGLKPATTNRRLSAISSLYSYMKRQGHDIENPCKYESRRKIADTIPNTIPQRDLQAAYSHAAGTAKIMLGLLITTGIRIQELLDLTYEDIDYEISSLHIRGKGNRERLVYTRPQYLQTIRESSDMGHAGRIFMMEQREARRIIFDALRPYSKAKQLSPHAIRHTFATNQAAHGTNCSTLAQLLGHQDLNTTQHYIDIGQSNARQCSLQHSILN